MVNSIFDMTMIQLKLTSIFMKKIRRKSNYWM